MFRKTVLLSLSLGLALTFTGCWDMVDIEKEAFILTIGIDTVKADGNPLEIVTPSLSPPNTVHVTFEVFSPRLAKIPGQKSTIVLHQDAPSVMEAIKLAQSQIPRRLNLSHLRAVVVGEECARAGIKDIMDGIMRSPRIADRFRILFVHDMRAEELLESEVETEDNIAKAITMLGELDTSYSFHRTISFADFYNTLLVNKGTDYALHYDLNEKKRLAKIGAVIFKNWKMLDWLDAYEVRSSNWLTGRIDQASVVIEHLEMLATYNVMTATGKIIPQITDQKPHFFVRIKTHGFLNDISNAPPEGIDWKLHDELENELAERIKSEALSAVALSQKKYRADYLGFGQKLFNKYPAFYKNLDWEQVFPDVPVEIEVKVHMARVGAKR